jgi:DNA repair protein RecN (Recombination protein N)
VRPAPESRSWSTRWALLRGGRARAELVRSGAEACTVDGQFELEGALARRVDTILAEPSRAAPRGTRRLRRGSRGAPEPGRPGRLRRGEDPGAEAHGPRSGRGRILIDGELGTLPQLTALGEQLIDVCSQHEHQSLTRPGRQLALLDEFAGAGPLLARYEAAYAAHTAARRAQEALARGRRAGGARGLPPLPARRARGLRAAPG